MLTFLIVAAGLLVVFAARESKKLRRALAKPKKTRLLPQVISLFVVSAQVSELLKVLDHVTVTNVAATLFLLVRLVASKSGTESELF